MLCGCFAVQVEAVHLLERFEAWTEKQMHAMEAARNLEKLGQNFDALLKVMDALFQVRRWWLQL